MSLPRVVDPTDYDHKAGVHATGNRDLVGARADCVEHFLDGLKQGWDDICPAGYEVAPAVHMALNAIRSGLDVLCEVVEGHRAAHVPADDMSVAS